MSVLEVLIMDRREFLERAAKSILLMAAVPVLSRCAAKSSPATTDGTTYTSQADSTGHQHTFAITTAESQSGAQFTDDTSTVSGHFHTVTLTSSDLSAIANSSTVSKTTSLAGSGPHSHTFSF